TVDGIAMTTTYARVAVLPNDDHRAMGVMGDPIRGRAEQIRPRGPPPARWSTAPCQRSAPPSCPGRVRIDAEEIADGHPPGRGRSGRSSPPSAETMLARTIVATSNAAVWAASMKAATRVLGRRGRGHQRCQPRLRASLIARADGIPRLSSGLVG